MTFRSILAPTDFSPQATAAVETATELAQRLQARLTLLHVYAAPGVMMPEGFIAASPTVVRDLLAAIDAGLAALRARIETTGQQAMAFAVQGAAVTEICRVARDDGHDLIVVGTHGRTGFSRFLLGSVAEHVVRAAPCPVLVVRGLTH